MPAEATSAKEDRRGNTVGPNRDRLTVGVDLGDRCSQYCILGLEGETLAEGQEPEYEGPPNHKPKIAENGCLGHRLYKQKHRVRNRSRIPQKIFTLGVC